MTVSIVKGVTPDGRVVTLRLNEDGSLAIGGVSTGGGGGDMTIGGATAANQDEQTALLEELLDRTPVLGQNTAALSSPVTLARDGLFAINFGSVADSAAANDSANASLIALFKRLLIRFTSLLTRLPLALSANGRFLVDASISSSAIVSLYDRVQSAPDLSRTFNYADAGTTDERVISIVSASTTIGATFTDTYTYAGSAGNYRMAGILRTQS